jgi:hypothetical protein
MAKAPGWVKSQNRAVFLTLPATARALGVHPETLRSWVKLGKVKAVHLRAPRDWWEREAKTSRGRWLIHIGELERILVDLYSGGEVPKGLMRRLRRLAVFPAEDVVPKSP